MAAPVSAANVPAGVSAHVADPAGAKRPRAQTAQLVAAPADARPAAQGVARAAPPASTYEPGGAAAHVADPAAAANVGAAQSTHAVAPLPDWYLPAAHDVQVL